MHKQVLRLFVVMAVLIGLGAIEIASAQNNVTFQVRMSVQIRRGNFIPASDSVWIKGSFDGWGAGAVMTFSPADSIARVTLSRPTSENISYKYFKTLRGGVDWEGDPNRSYTVQAGSQTIPPVWFNRDSVITTAVPVKFQVNMRVKMLEGTFRPDLGDSVRVPGSFNGWSTSTPAMVKNPTDSIYTRTYQIDEGSTVQYKFFKTARGGIDWEGDPNRTYTVPTGGGNVPVAWFDRDSIVNTPVSATLRFTADMQAMLQLGWFQPANRDTMEVRGGFNGWGTPRVNLQYDPLTTATYFTSQTYNGTSGDVINYKFFIDMDSALAVSRFPGYIHSGSSSNRDSYCYEHPYDRGDGNQQYTVNASGNFTVKPGWFYSGINPRGLLLNNTDSVTITLRVNMGPAKRAAVPFNPATDTAKIVLQDLLWVGAQQGRQGGVSSFAQVRNLVRQSPPNDSLYQVTFTIVGKTHYGMLYSWRYTKASGGGEETEGAGLGAQGGYRVRFIQPLGNNQFPRNYTAPQDTWQKDPPLPGENPPFSTDVKFDQTAGVPSIYRLDQNYPNPFNPATVIRYSIPEQSKVTLKVYNLLGQEVATLVNEVQPAGHFVARFEGYSLATGVYFYRLEAGKFSETKKMLLVK